MSYNTIDNRKSLPEKYNYYSTSPRERITPTFTNDHLFELCASRFHQDIYDFHRHLSNPLVNSSNISLNKPQCCIF